MIRTGTALFVSAAVAVLVLLWVIRTRPAPPASSQSPLTVVESPQANPAVRPSAALQSRSAKAGTPGVGVPQDYRDIFAGIDAKRQAMTNEALLWRTPLRYYGKVVDENGNPISGARAAYGGNAADETLSREIRNEGVVTTDERGIFRIAGLNGIGLMIEVTHPNYYPYPDNSTGFDVRSVPRKGYFSDSLDKAEIFRMHSKGHPVALIKRGGGLHTPADGTAATFPFRGRTRNEIIGQARVEGWKGSPDPQSDGHYDWKTRLTVPGGGILESTNYFALVAPESGYQESFAVNVSRDDPAWQSHVEKRIFIRLPSHFARATVSFDVYHDLFFSIDYFVNPDGSANLENDPAKSFVEP